MSTQDFILKKFGLSFDERTPMPIEIPDFGREQLATLFYELGFKDGAEIGVEYGAYSDILLRANPKLYLASIDVWKAHAGYRNQASQKLFNFSYSETKKRLAPYGTRSSIVKKFSLDAVNDFADNSLDFVYLDGNHKFYDVVADIHHWLKIIKPGGIISGHDFVKFGNSVEIHVAQAVNGYTDAYRIRPWFVLGLRSKKDGMVRDKYRSWMWVKR